MKGARPNITQAQIVAAVGWIVAQAVAWGWLDTRYSQIVLSVGTTLVAAGWQIADAIIRNGRNRVAPLPAATTYAVPGTVGGQPTTAPPTSGTNG